MYIDVFGVIIVKTINIHLLIDEILKSTGEHGTPEEFKGRYPWLFPETLDEYLANIEFDVKINGVHDVCFMMRQAKNSTLPRNNHIIYLFESGKQEGIVDLSYTGQK